MPEHKPGYGYYFRCIESIVDKTINEQFKQFDLTKSQQEVLHFLHRNRNTQIKQKDIEDYFHISNPTVTGILNRLEQKGYIERISSESDKRVKYIQQTEKAESLHQVLYKRIVQMEKTMVFSLSQKDQDTLYRLLNEVYQNLLKEDSNA
ncbi:MAG: MarR family transcriptional regulator [Bacillota bacterium]|nr:MarR family transcriptional regulator [Bacillota bacterium]